MDKETSVGAIVFRKDSDRLQFLILKRRDNSIWEFPKGHIKKDENELDTLKREIYEEIGIEEYELTEKFREKISYISSRGVIREFIFYLITSEEQIKSSEEHSEHKWITIEEAPDYFKYDDIIRLLKRVDRTLHER